MAETQTGADATQAASVPGTTDEAARIKASEEAARRTRAFNPDLMPGFRPDVQELDGPTHAQTIGDQTVQAHVAVGNDAVVANADQTMQPTAGTTGGVPTAVGGASNATGGSASGAATGGTTGAGTTGRTAGGDAIETGQGSTDTSRTGSTTRVGS